MLKVSTRVIDSEAYKEWKKMESDMEDFYKECPALKPATDVQAGILYVARIDCSWYRVVVDNFVVADGTAQVSLVDFADSEVVPLASIYPIQARFCQVPSQGLQCFLYGLEEFADSKSAQRATSK